MEINGSCKELIGKGEMVGGFLSATVTQEKVV